jgi:hypothetical protein
VPRQREREHPAEWARFFVGVILAVVIAAGFWVLVAAVLRALT